MDATTSRHLPPQPLPLARNSYAPWRRPIYWVSAILTVFCLATLAVALFTMLWQSLPLWQHTGAQFMVGREWHYPSDLFGALPMVYGTLVVAGIAIALATPVAVGSAIFTAEYLPSRPRLLIKGLIELLCGIPSVVYGLLGILFLREWVYGALEPFAPISGDSLLTAGLLLAVMILPTVATLCDDALRAVPQTQRRAARGLGLTRAEAVLHVALPQAGPGIFAAVFLGLGRALGETIAVFLIVGRQDGQWPANLLSPQAWIEPGQTLTSKLGGPETFIAYGDPLHWAAMVGLALLLLALVGACLATSYWIAGAACCPPPAKQFTTTCCDPE